MNLGYVVVTHLPTAEPFVECADIMHDLAEARDMRDDMAREWAAAGRPGRYTLAQLTELEGEDG